MEMHFVLKVRHRTPEKAQKQIQVRPSFLLSHLTGQTKTKVIKKETRARREQQPWGVLEAAMEGRLAKTARAVQALDPATFLHAFSCLTLPPGTRQAAGAALCASTSASHAAGHPILFALLLCGRKVVTLAGQKISALHADDIFLLTNFIVSSESF
eukprot:jgi/Mesen1/4496/ME000229S03512